MTNFNPLNFLNNFTPLKKAQTSNLTKNIENIQGNAQTPSTPNPVLNIQNSGAMPFFMLNSNNLMDRSQRLFMLKELLNLPQDLQEFLNIEITKTNTELLNNISKEISGDIIKNLSAKEISSLLNSKTPEAVDKLTNMLCDFARMQNTTAQREIKDLVNFLNSINVSNQTQDANQIIKNFILFYLPYLPMGENGYKKPEFDLEFFEKKEENNTSQSATIIVNTVNYGIVKGFLDFTFPDDLFVLIQASENFPSSMVEKLFMEKTKQMNINSKFSKEINKQKPKENFTKQNVKITADSSINSYLLFAIYSLIRLIIETDNSNPSSN